MTTKSIKQSPMQQYFDSFGGQSSRTASVPGGISGQGQGTPDIPQISSGGYVDPSDQPGVEGPQESRNPFAVPGGLEWGSPEMGQALIRAGSALAQGKSLSQGLARGTTAFADAARRARQREMAAQQWENQRRRNMAQQALEANQQRLENLKTLAKVRKMMRGEPADLEKVQGGLFNPRTGEWVVEPNQDANEKPVQFGANYYSPDGTPYARVDDPNTGDVKFRNLVTDEVVDSLPQGSVRAQDSAIGGRRGKMGRLGAKQSMQSADSVIDAQETLNQVEFLEKRYQNAGLGPSIIDMMARFAGEDIVGDLESVSNRQEMRSILADKKLEIRQRMEGQGEITEQESKTLYQVLPQITQNEDAFETVLEVMRRGAKREKAYWDQWMNLTPAEKRGYNYSYKVFKTQAPNPVPSYDPDSDTQSDESANNRDSNKIGNSLIDEADRITGIK